MKKILAFGGRGFVGSKVVQKLRKTCKVTTFDRSKGDKNHIQGNILRKEDVKKAVKDQDIVINFVGLTPIKQPKNGYEALHVDAVKNIINKLAKKQIYIHISAIGADFNSDISYLKTKGLAEKYIRKHHDKHFIVRPSIIYDKTGELIPLLVKTSWLRFFPKIPLKIQPVHRNDVAKIIYLRVKGKTRKKTVEIAGLEQYTFWEFAKRVKNALGYKQVNVPFFLYNAGMTFLTIIPGVPISMNQVKSLNEDFTTKNNYLEDKKPIRFSKWIKNQTFHQT